MSRGTNQSHILSSYRNDRRTEAVLTQGLRFFIYSSLSSTKRIIGSSLRNVECQKKKSITF